MAAELTGKREIKQERAARTRAVIARAAAEVFAECGFSGASVTKITRRAGLTLGAMYFHFESKEALAREIVRSQPERVTPPYETEGLQHAVDITLTWAHALLDDPFLLAGARLVMEQDSFIGPEENSHQQWTEVIAQSLTVAQRDREVRANVDVNTVARLIVNACTGAQMHAHLESGRQDLPQRIREMWNVLLPTIATPSALKRLCLDDSRGAAA
ncbi:ScbR family autoregulator-binding transcription factor [Streptomyces sp. NPDC085481]|uniref:ScbR family autoregulator-binding transcription factor n=1 Tax=Streptomyces sp. NPDC085481 TaxID=3365727 RepID=UPI0037CF5B2E